MANFPDYSDLHSSIKESIAILLRRHRILVNNPLADRDIFQVVSRPRNEVHDACNELILILQNVSHDQPYLFSVPSRKPMNQRYSSELSRNVLHDDGTDISRLTIKVDRVSMLVHTLSQIRLLCSRDLKSTIRGLYYTGKNQYNRKKALADACILDVCCLMRCTRVSLQLTSSDGGRVIGPLEFDYGDERINCMGIDGICVPREIEMVGQMNSGASFILLVEKDSIFTRLASCGFHKKFPCVMITGRGQAGVTTRRFLRMMWLELKLPVLGLFDGDIHGLIILSTYVVGSENMSFDSESLVTPEIKWLGVRPSDIDRYKIPMDALTELSERDLDLAKNWVSRPCFDTRSRRAWVRELKKMIELKRSVDIESLNALEINFLIDVYLPDKLKKRCWI